MRRITFTVEERLIDAARERARAESTTLNEQFRLWLSEYVAQSKALRYEAAMSTLRGKVIAGRKLSREETNER